MGRPKVYPQLWDELWMTERRVTQRMPVREIAAELGCSPKSVSRACDRMQLEDPALRRGGKPGWGVDLGKVVEALTAGRSLAQIAAGHRTLRSPDGIRPVSIVFAAYRRGTPEERSVILRAAVAQKVRIDDRKRRQTK